MRNHGNLPGLFVAGTLFAFAIAWWLLGLWVIGGP